MLPKKTSSRSKLKTVNPSSIKKKIVASVANAVKKIFGLKSNSLTKKIAGNRAQQCESYRPAGRFKNQTAKLAKRMPLKAVKNASANKNAAAKNRNLVLAKKTNNAVAVKANAPKAAVGASERPAGRLNAGKLAKKALPPKKKYPSAKDLAILGNSEVRKLLIDLAGENTLAVIRNFEGEITDESLAEKATIKVSEVRAVLNKLHYHNLVEYDRQKDDKTGWYSYYWHLNSDKLESFVNTQLESLNCVADACELGAGEFYHCSKCCEDGKTAYSFDIAMDTAFKCPKCGDGMKYIEPLAQQQKTLVIREIQK